MILNVLPHRAASRRSLARHLGPRHPVAWVTCDSTVPDVRIRPVCPASLVSTSGVRLPRRCRLPTGALVEEPELAMPGLNPCMQGWVSAKPCRHLLICLAGERPPIVGYQSRDACGVLRIRTPRRSSSRRRPPPSGADLGSRKRGRLVTVAVVSRSCRLGSGRRG